eukprot:TRINITY_DN36856_c0_g1_i1.p1 TRINITY_DN36856_c0_g1~~TRINITY_DN36856_c0_g1_i1.p1  ORF type:complete len:255 (+),score=53.23 TRINITY_DN36856_c0_g1_i1:290-1054(+)
MLSDDDLSLLASTSASGNSICALERQYRRSKGTSPAMSRAQFQKAWRFTSHPRNLFLQRLFDLVALKQIAQKPSAQAGVMSCYEYISLMLQLQLSPITEPVVRLIFDVYLDGTAVPAPDLLSRSRMIQVALALIDVARARRREDGIVELGCAMSPTELVCGTPEHNSCTQDPTSPGHQEMVVAAVGWVFRAAGRPTAEFMGWTEFRGLCFANYDKMMQTGEQNSEAPLLNPVALFFLPFNLTVLKDGRVLFFCG